MIQYRIRISVKKSTIRDCYDDGESESYEMELEPRFKDGEKVPEDELKYAVNLMADKLIEIATRTQDCGPYDSK